jgi:hypothetical protein
METESHDSWRFMVVPRCISALRDLPKESAMEVLMLVFTAVYAVVQIVGAMQLYSDGRARRGFDETLPALRNSAGYLPMLDAGEGEHAPGYPSTTVAPAVEDDDFLDQIMAPSRSWAWLFCEGVPLFSPEDDVWSTDDD